MVLDFDGTIGDSMGVWFWVDREFLRRRGLVPPPEYGRMLSTLGFVNAADYVIEHFDLKESPEAIMDEWNELALEAYTSRVFLKPYVSDWLDQMKGLGARLGIATTLSPMLLHAALANNHVEDMFDALATGYEVTHDKNEPDVYLLAAYRMDVEPEDCVVFEDILPGIRSANRAGMTTIAVRDDNGHQDEAALRSAADGFIDSFAELLF